MLIISHQSIPHLVINDTPVKQVTQIKTLGLYSDNNLSWNIHIKELAKKIASGIGALKF